ncbi:MAG TPA: hypothetical protein VHY35_06085 [Stellaceae bacterium]|jgi:hypothetical protein|nr:hypothetical protein [Stellaceae bacterium]
MKPRQVAILLLLAGCAGTGNWSKSGVDAAGIGQEYQDCRDLAGTAIKTQADIDQDIGATRSSDAQHADIVRLREKTSQDQTRDRAGSIVDSCMKAKGFIQQPR